MKKMNITNIANAWISRVAW